VSGPDHVDRGTGAINLGIDVLDAGEFKDRADGAAGDDAGAGRSRFKEHFGVAIDADHRVGDGAFRKVDGEHLLTSGG